MSSDEAKSAGTISRIKARSAKKAKGQVTWHGTLCAICLTRSSRRRSFRSVEESCPDRRARQGELIRIRGSEGGPQDQVRGKGSPSRESHIYNRGAFRVK